MSDYPHKGINKGIFLGYTFGEGDYGRYAKMTFEIKGKKFWNFVNEPGDKVWKYGKELDDAETVEEHRKMIFRMLARPAIAIVGQGKVEEAVRGINNFKDYVETLRGIVPANTDELDIFLQYQYRPKKGQERTYLELPNTEEQGQWCVKSEGEYKEQIVTPYNNKTIEALIFVGDGGKKHPFVRNGWFVNSNFWNPQGVVTKEAPVEAPSVGTESGTDVPDDLPF